jgi:hypothetical protein
MPLAEDNPKSIFFKFNQSVFFQIFFTIIVFSGFLLMTFVLWKVLSTLLF